MSLLIDLWSTFGRSVIRIYVSWRQWCIRILESFLDEQLHFVSGQVPPFLVIKLIKYLVEIVLVIKLTSLLWCVLGNVCNKLLGFISGHGIGVCHSILFPLLVHVNAEILNVRRKHIGDQVSPSAWACLRFGSGRGFLVLVRGRLHLAGFYHLSGFFGFCRFFYFCNFFDLFSILDLFCFFLMSIFNLLVHILDWLCLLHWLWFLFYGLSFLFLRIFFHLSWFLRRLFHLSGFFGFCRFFFS